MIDINGLPGYGPVMLRPLFGRDGMYAPDCPRKKMVLLGEAGKYPIYKAWHKQAEDCQTVYTVINNRLVNLRLTTDGIQGATDAAIEQYIDQRIKLAVEQYWAAKKDVTEWVDFVGALVLGELPECKDLSKRHWEWAAAREDARRQAAKAEEEARRQAANAQTNEMVRTAVETIRRGGTVTNETVEYNGIQKCLWLHLADRYGVQIPIRTKGWIAEKLKDVRIEDGQCVSYRYRRTNRQSKGSPAAADYINQILAAVI